MHANSSAIHNTAHSIYNSVGKYAKKLFTGVHKPYANAELPMNAMIPANMLK